MSIEKNLNGGCQLLYKKIFKEQARGVARHLVNYLYKEHDKEVLKIFTVFHQEETKLSHWENDKPLYFSEKAAKEIINEQPFACLEFPDNFSFGAKKEVELTGPRLKLMTSLSFPPKKDFLTPC